MKKYSLELKLEIMRYIIQEKHSMREASRKYGISKGDIQTWTHAYEYHGIEGLNRHRNNYTGDFKIHVIEYMLNKNISARKTAAKFNISSHRPICCWKQIYIEKGKSALYEENRGRPMIKEKKFNQQDLLDRIKYLEMENEYLKKLNALVQEKEKSTKKIKQV